MLTIRVMKNSRLGLRVLFSSLLAAFCISCSVTGPHDTASLVAELDAELPMVVARGNSPSIQAAVIQGDRIVWSRTFGENTSVEHVYMNASVQKVFTAIAVLQLVEEGLVDLDAEVSTYVPFAVRHPDFEDTPITVRMLLAHRSGLDSFRYQFAWDTGNAFSPHYRPPCPDRLLAMSLEEYLIASLTPEEANYESGAWVLEPGQGYHYSVSAYPLLRYLVGEVAGQSYDTYMRESIFGPLGMTNSGFSADVFEGRHAIPYTRIDGENIELPLWDGQGSMMHTTAADTAKLILTLMDGGQYGDFQLLQPETIELMQQRTTHFRTLFRSSDDLPGTGHGLSLYAFRGGWFGIGGSAPGYQTLLRFNPSRQAGYVIISNVNAILGGGTNYESARSEIYAVQDALISTLDPTLVIRRWISEILLAGALALYFLIVLLWVRRRRAKRRKAEVPRAN